MSHGQECPLNQESIHQGKIWWAWPENETHRCSANPSSIQPDKKFLAQMRSLTAVPVDLISWDNSDRDSPAGAEGCGALEEFPRLPISPPRAAEEDKDDKWSHISDSHRW
jgi:hypothetical protein